VSSSYHRGRARRQRDSASHGSLVVYTDLIIQIMYWLITRSHTFGFNVSWTITDICDCCLVQDLASPVPLKLLNKWAHVQLMSEGRTWLSMEVPVAVSNLKHGWSARKRLQKYILLVRTAWALSFPSSTPPFTLKPAVRGISMTPSIMAWATWTP